MARNIKATIGNDGNPNHTYSLSSQNGAGTITVMRTGITFTELRASVVIAYPDDIVNVLAKDESPSCAASGYVSLPIPPLPSPTPTPSVTASPTPTPTPSITATPTPSITPTPTPSVTQGLFLNGNLLTSDPSTPYSANIVLSNNTFNDITQLGAGSYTISGNISGTGAIRSVIGAGKVVTLSGNNSQADISTNSNYIDSGTIAFANASALSTGGLWINGGTAKFNNTAFTGGTLTIPNGINSYQNSTSFLDLEGNGTSENTLTLNSGNIGMNEGSSLRITRSSGGSGTTNISSTFSGPGTLEIGNTNGGNALSSTSKGKFIPTNSSAFNSFTGTIKLSGGANLALISGGLLNNAAGNNLAFVPSISYLSLARQTSTIINQISGHGYILTDSPTVTSGIAALTINSGDGSENVGIGNLFGNLGASSGYNLISLDKVSSGTFKTESSSSNKYSAGTTIDGGTINLVGNGGLGTGAVVVNAAGTLNKNGFNPPNTIVNNGGTVNP